MEIKGLGKSEVRARKNWDFVIYSGICLESPSAFKLKIDRAIAQLYQHEVRITLNACQHRSSSKKMDSPN